MAKQMTGKNCITCKRSSNKRVSQQMANLPDYRIQPSTTRLLPFHTVGIDCAGPFETKLGRKGYKRYIVLFVCCQYRAVHIEMLYSMDKDSFLCALTRFVHRRSRPSLILSDNGSNFIGANNELLQIWKDSDQPSLINYSPEINWQFNTPYKSHSGGHFERYIQTSKRILYKLIGRRILDDEQFSTCISITEGLINSMPLSYTNAGDEQAPTLLTPSHFLMGQGVADVADLSSSKAEFRRRWHHTQSLMNAYWHRFSKEIVPHLHLTRKWRKEQKDLKIGDIVVWPNSDKRGHWPLAVVLDTKITAADGLVRSVLIKHNETTAWKAVNALIYLFTPEDS